MFRRLSSLCVAFVLVATGCATNPVTGDRDFVLMSREQEIELGEDFHQRILEQYPVYENEALQQRVDEIGQRLAENSHRPELDYEFTVVDSPDVNAFALPGGYIYITRGIMAYFNSEAELAGVLGHELGHVTARHAVQQHSAETASSLLGALLIAGTGAGQGAAQLFQTVQLAAIRGYGREQELQADRLGAEYLARTGYDSEEMLDVVGVLADQEQYAEQRSGGEGSAYHGVFSTHPANDARRQEVIRAARKHQADNPRPERREEYLRLIDGMTFGPSADQGMVVADEFLHLELDAALRAPEDWTIVNQPQRLIFQGPGESALLVAEVRPAESDQSARELLAERLEGADTADARAIEAGSYDGYTAVSAAQTEIGPRRLRHVVIRKDDDAWYFTGVARERGALSEYDDAFFEIATSLEPLDAEQRQQAQPLEIVAYTAQEGDTYADLAEPVADRLADPAARLRLLNGDWPEGEPEAGRVIKILR